MKVITKIVDDLHCETRAMLQAFYSRSHMGIEERVADLGGDDKKIKESLKKYYVNYGHQSVGEGASITIFLEDISMLAAKAIQSFSQYRGQEGSTRFIDYSKQNFICPEGGDVEFYSFWSERFREFYTRALNPTIEYLRSKYEGEGKTYENALKVKALDILRGYLPAGFATKVAWTGSFRDLGEHLRHLLNHPLNEVKEIAKTAYSQLKLDYPNSFRDLRESDYFENPYFYSLSTEGPPRREFSTEFKDSLPEYKKHNPIFNLPRIDCQFTMDFASFRDLQRHRRMWLAMPILSTKIGMESFYIDNLPPSLQDEAKKLIEELSFSLEFVEKDVYRSQYICPMGLTTDCMINMDVHQAVYLAELRSSGTVHPTLRVWAQDLGKFLENKFDIKCRVDYSEDTLNLRRASQDIVKKEE